MQPTSQQLDADRIARIGGWLFQRRTWTPVPLLVVFLLIRAGEAPASTALLAAGIAIVIAGESIRLWAAHHIGAISRTRADRLGPLVSTGPFALVRNPLYFGNIVLWVGFALSARLLWMAPVVVLGLGLEYHAIVRWEERLLDSRRGEEYRAYVARVPRWLPKTVFAASAPSSAVAFSWRETFFSERGTLLAIAIGYLLLYLKFTI